MNFRYGLQEDCRRIYDLICEMKEKVLLIENNCDSLILMYEK